MPSKPAKGFALWPSMLVGVIAILWLAQELKWLPLSLPLGPIGLFVAGLAMARMAQERQ